MIVWLVTSPEFSSVIAGLTVSVVPAPKAVELARVTLLMRMELADALLRTRGRVVVIELADQESISTGCVDAQ